MAQANVFNLGVGFTNLETVTVGDAGNPPDTLVMSYLSKSGGTSGYGGVNYNYSIGKYEVTAKQYTDFLNSKAKTDTYGLYNSLMYSEIYGCKIQQTGAPGSYAYSVADEYANRPVNYVSFWDACRFTNWLGNGQGTGDTENGAYTLAGYNSDGGQTITRNSGATWAVASEDEWYKAAYYKGDGTYWLCATQSDSIDTSKMNSNFTVGHTTDVGSYPYPSHYGTFDQDGNLYELSETLLDNGVAEEATYRVMRGGDLTDEWEVASDRDGCAPITDSPGTGFRVTSVPEPSSLIAVGFPVLVLGLRKFGCLRK
jgi:formylglycine-generating enzyme required for sulfatase activity